jgi:VCBS repeat-containing protein
MGADGFTFVIKDPSSPDLGQSGGALGYGGINRSLAISYDFYSNFEYNDPNADFVGLLTNGNLTHNSPISIVQVPIDNGATWYNWIDYNGSTLEVRYSLTSTRPSVAQLTYNNVNLQSLIGSTAEVGFTGATGGLTATERVTSWEFRDTYQPITSINHAPIAVADTNTNDAVTEAGIGAGNAVLAGDASASGNVLANDTDVDLGDTRTVSAVAGGIVGSARAGTYGSVTINANGSYAYSLDNTLPATNALAQGESRTEIFTYTVRDAAGATATAALTITVTGTNDAPVAVADTAAGTEDSTLVTGSVAGNDGDVDAGSSLTYTLTAPLAGLTLTPDGSYSFNPSVASYQDLAQGETRDVAATYSVTDQFGASAAGNLTITVTGTNDRPVANAVSNAVLEDATITGTVTAIDADAGQTAGLTYALLDVAAAPVGLTFNANGTYSFDASSYDSIAEGQTLVLSVPFTASDASSASTAAILSIAVAGTNDSPVAVADTLAAIEDTAVTFTAAQLLGNDTDIDSAPATLRIASVTSGSGGTAVLEPGGSVTFTPDAEFNGPASFSYTTGDGSLVSNAATVTVNVAAVNDAPVAVANTLADVAEDSGARIVTVAELLANDIDIDNANSDLRIASVTGATGGTILFDPAAQTIAFTPSPNYNGPAGFSYTTSDGTTESAAAPVSFTITPVNDAPIFTLLPGDAVTDVVNDRPNHPYGGTGITQGGTVHFTDVDGGSYSAVVSNLDPAQGTSLGQFSGRVLGDNATVGWGYSVPVAAVEALRVGEVITERGEIRLFDGTDYITQQVSVTLTGANDAPVALDSTGVTNEDAVVTLDVASLISDVDGDSLTVSASVDAAQGTVSIEGTFITFTPAANFNGTASISYTVTDGSGAAALSDTALITVGVAAVNDAPVIASGSSVSLAELSQNTNGILTDPVGTSGTLAFADVDLSDTHTVSLALASVLWQTGSAIPEAITAALAEAFSATLANASTGDGTGSLDWAFSLGNPLLDFLREGETLTLTYNVSVTDSSGASDTKPITLTIAGANDVPIVEALAGDRAYQALDEGSGPLRTEGTLTITDRDLTDSVSVSANQVEVVGGSRGGLTDTRLAEFLTLTPATLTADPGSRNNLAWSFNSGAEAFDFLAAGEILELRYRVRATDDSGAGNNIGDGTVTIQIEGTNDAAVVTLPPVQTVTEAGGSQNASLGVPTATSTLTATDVDGTANLFLVSAGTSTYGTWSIAANGTYSYSLNNALPNVDALTQGQSVFDTFTVRTVDGTEQVVTVNVVGTNDAAVITGTSTGLVVESGGVANAAAGTPTAAGTLSATDVDSSAAFVAQTSVAGTNGYGRFSIGTNGAWSYTLNNDHPAVQALNTNNPPLADTLVVTTADGTQHTLSVAIQGANDAPVVLVELTDASTNEDAVYTLNAAAAFSDVDLGDTLTYSATGLPAWLSLNTATGQLTGTPLNGDVGPRTITVTAADRAGASAASEFVLTVVNTNDGPVAVADTGVAGENQTRLFDVVANDTDVDLGDSLSLASLGSVTVTSANGSVNAIDARSAFTIENGKVLFTPGDLFDALNTGQTATVQLGYTVADRAGATSTSTLTLTVNGTSAVSRDGTNQADTLNGDLAGLGADDILRGLNGDDLIFGFAGSDDLYGGNGQDRLEGGVGRDKLYGENGNDILDGGAGFDFLDGGRGDDLLRGGANADVFYFGQASGSDRIADFEVGVDHFAFEAGTSIRGLSQIDTNNDRVLDATLVQLSTGSVTLEGVLNVQRADLLLA